MRIDVHHHYDAAPGAVHAMLTDPAFWQSVLRGSDQVANCQVDAVDQGVHLSVDVKAPSQVSKFTGPVLAMTLRATWAPDDAGWGGPVNIEVQKVPGGFTGTSTITPDGPGTAVTYTGDFTVRIPFVGKALEQKAGPYLTAVLDDQQAQGVAWLTSHT